MINNPYAGAFDQGAETRAVALEMAKQSAQKEAESRERSAQILDYCRNGQRKGIRK